MNTWEPNANVQLLSFATAVENLRSDLARPEPCLAYTYLVEPLWFADLFGAHLSHSMLMLIADNRQRPQLRTLLSRHKKLQAATWSTNRTMHDKTLIFPVTGITYLTTANITRGSWTLSLNTVARIQSPAFTHALETQFHEHWRVCRILPRLQIV